MGIREALQKSAALDPFSAFMFANMDTAGDPNYFGFVTLQGSWIIKRLSTSGGDMTVAAGDSGYATAWSARASHTYMPVDQIL